MTFNSCEETNIKIIIKMTLVILGLLFMNQTGSSSNKGKSENFSFLDTKITFHESSKDAGIILRKLSHIAKIPIGFERRYDEESKDLQVINIDVNEGTIEDALDQFISFVPMYKWRRFNGIVNVFPKKLASENLLETKVESFIIQNKGDSIKSCGNG